VRLVVIILWGRFGTPLPDSVRKPTGERYLSGTEWEYHDAISGKSKPEILIYRRTAKLLLDADDPELPSKLEQRQRVNGFFERFRNADGSYKGGVNTYDTPSKFAELFEEQPAHIAGGENWHRKDAGRKVNRPSFPARDQGVS
jgi:hypothetical protein